MTCFVCNTRPALSPRTSISLIEDTPTLQSGKKLTERLSEIVNKPINEKSLHSTTLCKKCLKSVTEYDSIQIRLKLIQSELTEHFKKTLPKHNLNYDTYNQPKVKEAKKFVLPASKLQPLPPDFQLKGAKWSTIKPGVGNKIGPVVTVSSGSNLKVTVGTSVLTQSIKTTGATSQKTMVMSRKEKDVESKVEESERDDNTNLSTAISSLSSFLSKSSSSMLSFNVNGLPKDFLSSPMLKMSDGTDLDITVKRLKEDSDAENNDEQPMEIDEDCSLAVVTADSGDKLVFDDDKSQDSEDLKPGYLELSVVDEDQNKLTLSKLQILQHYDDDDDPHTIVMDESVGSMIRVVSGQKLLYGSNISLDQQDNQDSNDESQIELQVSGDEETANAIIAAAQEQGGAFIKVGSGEMYRVKSVQSKIEDSKVHVEALQIIENRDGHFKCLLCEKNDKQNSSWPILEAEAAMKHLKTEHDARLYLCRLCGSVFAKRAFYLSHLDEHVQASSKKMEDKKIQDKPKTHECNICFKKYNTRTLLAEHMNLHSGARPHVCRICHKTFASKYTHQAHLKTHLARPRPFKCNECGKSFFTPQNLAQHAKTHSGVKDFVCNVCGKAFATQHNLVGHQVVHTGEKPFVCGLCGKQFARRAEVRDHMRTHTGERPFSCEICGASFTQRSNLHSHKRATHLDDKRYVCSYCPKRFKRRRLLDYHIKASHTGERPLKCETCNATFVYPEHYKKHIRIHSGEKPYTCEVCGKSFNSRDNRNTHRFVHSDRKPYECVVCGAGYMRKQLLYHHMNSAGHLAESIVVNQPRVAKVANATQAVVIDSANEKTENIDTIYEAEELQLETSDGKTVDTNLFMSGDRKLILQDGKSYKVIQDSEDPTLLTLHTESDLGNDIKSEDTILETVSADQLDESQIVTGEVNGGMVRLVQIQLPDGNNGWVAINS